MIEMLNDKINLPEDLGRCVAFHGHLCPGVVLGYCAAKFGMGELAAGRSEDEEFITIVENDTCAVDAIQVLTGCTFGKGNLYFHDYGKMVFTFARRSDGRSVRLYYQPINQPEVGDVPESQRRQRQIEFLLSHDPLDLFQMQKNVLDRLPMRARIHENRVCDYRGEWLMTTRARQCYDKIVCIPCNDEYLLED